MASVDVSHAHALIREEARRRAESLALGLQVQLGIVWRWEDDVIRFEIPAGIAKGARGQLTVGGELIRLELELPFLLRLLKGQLEEAVRSRMDALLQSAPRREGAGD